MNVHKIQIFCGQIKFIKDLMNDFADKKVKVNIDQVNKIDLFLTVETGLNSTETIDYIKKLIKQSPLGSALHYSVKLAP